MISIEASIPARSPAGLAARDIFLEQSNDVNFYVEDQDQENLYHEILAKLFPNLRIGQIFPLAGKQNVLNHARDAANASRAKRSVYIVDKDFDDLLGHMIVKPNIIYLNRYCIENFLLDEDAAVQIAIESNPKKSRTVLKKHVNFPRFLRNTVEALDPLFRLFFAVQRFNLGLKNCDLKPEQFSTKKNRWQIDSAKITAYEADVRKHLRRAGVFKTRGEFTDFLSTAFPKKGPLDANISGKFILNMVFHYLREKTALGDVKIDSLRYRLARNSTLKNLAGLEIKVRRFLKAS